VTFSSVEVMKVLFLGEEESTAREIEETLRDDESIFWYTFHDLETGTELGEFDVVILDDTTAKPDVVYSIIKLNCHLAKPVLVLVGSISAAEENCIWGIGVTDIIKLPFTKDECRKKIDSTYRWKWYYDRCKCHNTECTR